MSQKNREIKKLRREVEILRAQLKGVEGSRTLKEAGSSKSRVVAKAKSSRPSTTPESFETSSYVRADLHRSLIITAIITVIIGGLAASQPHWPKIASAAVKILPF